MRCVLSELTLHTCDMSEPMFKQFCTKLWIMLHMKMCNVLTYVTHEYKMCSARTYSTYEKCYVRTYVTHETLMVLIKKMMSLTTKLYVRTYCRLPTKIWCLLSEHMLPTKMCNVRTHENMTSCVRNNDINENVYCLNILSARIWDIFYLNKCDLRNCVISEHRLYTNMNIFCLNLCYTKM